MTIHPLARKPAPHEFLVEKAVLLKLSPKDVKAYELAGDRIQAILRRIQEEAQVTLNRALAGVMG